MPRMDPFELGRFRIWRPTGWQMALIIALATAAIIALLIVAAGLVLIITPIALVAVLAQRFFARRAARPTPGPAAGRPTVIDVEYQVIAADPAADERGPRESGEDRPRMN